MSKASVWVELELQPGKREGAIDDVQAEAGTERRVLHTDGDDENVLYFDEQYLDSDALTAHGGSEWFKAFGPKVGPVLAGRPSMQFLTPLSGKGR